MKNFYPNNGGSTHLFIHLAYKISLGHKRFIVSLKKFEFFTQGEGGKSYSEQVKKFQKFYMFGVPWTTIKGGRSTSYKKLVLVVISCAKGLKTGHSDS